MTTNEMEAIAALVAVMRDRKTEPALSWAEYLERIIMIAVRRDENRIEEMRGRLSRVALLLFDDTDTETETDTENEIKEETCS